MPYRPPNAIRLVSAAAVVEVVQQHTLYTYRIRVATVCQRSLIDPRQVFLSVVPRVRKAASIRTARCGRQYRSKRDDDCVRSSFFIFRTYKHNLNLSDGRPPPPRAEPRRGGARCSRVSSSLAATTVKTVRTATASIRPYSARRSACRSGERRHTGDVDGSAS